MPAVNRQQTCCFSGYRPEKMPFSADSAAVVDIPAVLREPLLRAALTAYHSGYTCFLSGMSRGFDLWAAQTVLHLRQRLPVQLYAIQPFPEQAAGWAEDWQHVHAEVKAAADACYTVSPAYEPQCFYLRNQFLVDASSHLICYYDGQTGGTKYTLACARKAGLSIENIADPQLTLFSF